MNKAEFAVDTLMVYARENQMPARSTSDLSPLEQWLLVKLFHESQLKNMSYNNPFTKLIKLAKETSGGGFQYYYNMSKNVHTISLTNIRTLFSNESLFVLVREVERYIIENRTKSHDKRYTLFTNEK